MAEMSVREAGQLGGRKTSERHGREHYERIGKQGGAKVKQLIQAGRAAEEDKNVRD